MRTRITTIGVALVAAATLVAAGCGEEESEPAAEQANPGGFGEPTLVAEGGSDPDVAFAPDGTLYVSWVQPADGEAATTDDEAADTEAEAEDHADHEGSEHEDHVDSAEAAEPEDADHTDSHDDSEEHDSSDGHHSEGPKLDVMLAASTDGGATFGEPVQVNDVDGEVFSGSNTKPKILVLSDERMLVSWTTTRPYEGQPMGQYKVRVATSDDGGESFEPAKDLMDERVEGAVTSESYQELRVTPDGNVIAAVLDYRGSFETPSVDTIGLRTMVWRTGEPWFGKSQLVDEQTCECCDNAIAADDERVLLAYRDQVKDGDTTVRDSSVRSSDDDGATWSDEPVRLGEDDWEFDQCPESGPDIGIDGAGDVHGVYYTGVEGRPGVYHSHSTDGGETFTAHELEIDEEFYPSSTMDLATLDEGAIIAWDDNREDESLIGVAQIDADGASTVETGVFEARTPAVATLDGHTVIAMATDEGVELASSGSHEGHDMGGEDSSGGDEESGGDEADVEFSAVIEGGVVEGGPQSWRAEEGDTVSITAESDVAEELHLHGYDISRDIPAGGSATITFEADTTGSFEVELEESKQLLGTLEVR